MNLLALTTPGHIARALVPHVAEAHARGDMRVYETLRGLALDLAAIERDPPDAGAPAPPPDPVGPAPTPAAETMTP